MAKKIGDTKKMTHDEWVALRKSSIGGSDAAVCVDMNAYGSLLTLYADKKGLSNEREDTEAMRLGRDLEQYVADRFCEDEGKKVRNDYFMYADDEYDFLTANIDRKVVGENAGLECKVMGSFTGYNIEAGEVPSHYYCQCQHYAMVMGFDRVYLAIYVLQRGLFTTVIERDDDFIKSLREAEIAFWKGYVEPGIMPDPDGSEASVATLKELYPKAVPDTEVSISGLDYLVKDMKAYEDLEKVYKQKKEAIKGRIEKMLGSYEYGTGVRYSVSWKNQSKSTVPDKKLKAKYPKIYEELVETSEYRVFRTKENKKK